MSMPVLPKPEPELTRDQSLTMILSSIALEEAALSHIINAEGEKIQHVLNGLGCGYPSVGLDGILAVNKSVYSLLEMVMQNQLIIKNKMEKVLEYLPKPHPLPPPTCIPFPICPPEPACPAECTVSGSSSCFYVSPDCYECGAPLRWNESGGCRCAEDKDSGCTKLFFECAGSYHVDICLDTPNVKCPCYELLFVLSCEDRIPVVKKVVAGSCRYPCASRGKAIIQVPCCGEACNLSVFANAPRGFQVCQGKIAFTKR